MTMRRLAAMINARDGYPFDRLAVKTVSEPVGPGRKDDLAAGAEQ
jgi:hypothetical protein